MRSPLTPQRFRERLESEMRQAVSQLCDIYEAGYEIRYAPGSRGEGRVSGHADQTGELATARLRPRGVGAGEEQRELVTAEAARDLAVGEPRLQDATDLRERGAALDVPVGVDQRLELVHVEEHDRESIAFLDRLLDRASRGELNGPEVLQATARELLAAPQDICVLHGDLHLIGGGVLALPALDVSAASVPAVLALPWTVAGEAASVPELNGKLANGRWDVVMMDLAMPGCSGLEALQEIHARCPRLPILVLTMHPEDQYAVRAIVAGASGYLHKGGEPAEIITALRTVATGKRYISAAVAERLASAGLRVETDLRNEKINYKVREHSLAKVPVLLVVGKREAEGRKVALRRLGGDAQEVLALEDAIHRLKAEN